VGGVGGVSGVGVRFVGGDDACQLGVERRKLVLG